MIEIRCVVCNEPFTVSDESAGLTEKCPACGALNDIPDESVALDETDAGPIDTSLPGDVPPRGGMPAWLWWLLLTTAVGGFALAIYWLSADDWEKQHLEDLAAKSNTAQQLISSGDFAGAVRQYDLILAEVGPRNLQSQFLQDLVRTTKQRRPMIERDAKIAAQVHDAEDEATAKQFQPAIDAFINALALAPSDPSPDDPGTPILDRTRRELVAARDALATQSTGISSILDPTTFPSAQSADASTQPDQAAIFAAIKQFQRGSEGFPSLVASNPIVFIDAKGKYRQRQYVVWAVSSTNKQDEDHASVLMQLEYQETSRMTAPHDDRAAAAHDVNFLFDETDHTIYHQTQFRLKNGRWVASKRLRGDGQNYVNARDPEFADKAGGFDRQDLWALEDRVFSGAR